CGIGRISSWANDQLAVGDVLESMPPMGRFYVPLDPERGREYVGIAGGSGITPVLGILRTVLHAEPLSRFTLIYGNRSSSTTMFRVELENLKNEFMQRLNIVHVLEHNSDELPIFKGRLDEAKCASLFEHWVSVTSLDAVFVCGPQPMMDAAIAALQSSGVDRSLIKFEKFASVPPKVRKQVEQSQATNGHAESCNATLRIDGVDHHLEVPMGGTTTLLDAALAAHIDAPYACAAGVCSTCVARLVDGEVAMGANYALDDDEVEDGLILTCQSRPVTRHLVVEYDV
ncbi:MAG: 2Fe-2S iron-sulfur cluster-binding protein, partial [Myxococcota bacterium]